MCKKTITGPGGQAVSVRTALFAVGLACFVAAWGLAMWALAATDTHVTIDNFTFGPAALTVPVGTTIVFENDDDTPHTVVAEDKSFKSKALDTLDKFSVTLTKAGEFNYFCGLHPRMTGKILVTP
jgi:plastocyanin